MRVSDASMKKPKIGLFTASTWLTIIIIVESTFMIAWIAKEYLLFDYKCAIPNPENPSATFGAPAALIQSESGGLSPRLPYAQYSEAQDPTSRTSRQVPPFEREAFDDDVYPLDRIASSSAHSHRFRRDATQAETADSEQATEDNVEGQAPMLRIIRRRKKKRPTTTSTEAKPTVESSVAIEPLRILESGVPERPLRTKTTWRKYHPRGVPTSAGTVIKRRRLKRPRTSPNLVPSEAVHQETEKEPGDRENSSRIHARATEPTTDGILTTTTVRTYVVEEEDFRQRSERVTESEVLDDESPLTQAVRLRPTTTRPVTTTVPSTTTATASSNPDFYEKAASLGDRQAQHHNFTEQLSTFTSSAVCVARTLVVVWCVLQVAAAVPFLVGVCARLRCLFTAHLVLDALFLVVLFIYSVTMTIFALILFICVADMSVQTLFEWLLFAAALDVLFVIYVATFVATLRCCEALLVDQPNSSVRTYRAKSLLYTHIPDTDTFNDMNSV